MSARARYDLEERLGDGGAGTVFRARQRSSGGRLVALKRIRVPAGRGGADALLPRLRHDAEILAALDHPFIVRVYEVLPDGDGVAIAMQYAPGGSLADRIAASGPLDATGMLAFAIPIAHALSAVHAHGLVHGGISPGNILFTADGQPLLSDFGLGGDAVPDPAADVYRLGLVCAEALTGSSERARQLPLSQTVPDCPTPIARVIEHAISPRIEDRYATAADFAAALRAASGAAVPASAAAGAAMAQPPPAPASDPPTDDEWADDSVAHDPWTEAVAAPRRPPNPVLILAVVAVVGVAIAAVVNRPPVPQAAPPTEESLVGAAPGQQDAPQEQGQEPAHEPPPQPAAEPAPQPVACPQTPQPPAGDGQRVFEADTDGDGCPSWLRWDGAQLVLFNADGQPGQTFRMGSPGDQLVVGDWDCDGAHTPALYRPSNGQVYLFDGWAGPDRDMPARVGPTLAPNGQARLVQGQANGSGCADTVGLA